MMRPLPLTALTALCVAIAALALPGAATAGPRKEAARRAAAKARKKARRSGRKRTRKTTRCDRACRRKRKTREARRVKKSRFLGGTHWRIKSKAGVVHVWRPRGFRRKGGGIVVYVHGYQSSADKTWGNKAIAEQFRMSRQNALFIVVDGPQNPRDKVKFPALTKLFTVVQRYTRLRLPRGHIVAIGHSAAYRTIVNWLDYRYLDHVVLVDALYANGPQFYAWMETHKYKDWHKLIVISYDTLSQTKRFLSKFKYVVKRKRFPDRYGEFTPSQKRGRILFIRSQYGHAQLINNKRVIPLLLRLTRLALL
ncbi:MAG: hypothetical protein CSA65_07860 [Proteobacteria bacterium]|nr:MAG: hypothetical protein CSA65_07860 [Pseudomonadota bacterium]